MKTEDRVVGMYNQVPYPDYGSDPLEDNYMRKKIFIDHVLGFNGARPSVYDNKKVLDAGCGTGRESIYMASRGGRVTSLDLTDKSLEVARKHAGQKLFKHDINFIKGSIFEMPFEDDSFDIVVSSGVIHHTLYPEKAFLELVRVLKPGGFLILYVYNNYAHMVSNLRRGIVYLFSGNEIHKRAKIARKLFPRYLKGRNDAQVYDEFSHPHKSEHSIKEVLSWFDEYNIKYESVYPKFGIRGFIKTQKNLHKYHNTGEYTPMDKKFNKPNLVNRITSGILQFMIGFRAYSGGYRFLGIKEEKN